MYGIHIKYQLMLCISWNSAYRHKASKTIKIISTNKVEICHIIQKTLAFFQGSCSTTIGVGEENEALRKKLKFKLSSCQENAYFLCFHMPAALSAQPLFSALTGCSWPFFSLADSCPLSSLPYSQQLFQHYERHLFCCSFPNAALFFILTDLL